VSPAGPDIAGFRGAQDRLIDELGQDVTFKLRQTPQYPPGTRLNDDTGRPFDPTIKPLAGTDGFDEQVVRCTVVYRPIQRVPNAPDETTWGGIRRDQSMALAMKVVDYPRVADADEADVNGINYKITEIVPDGLTEVQRYVAFLEAL
jgi:hypothetical protein